MLLFSESHLGKTGGLTELSRVVKPPVIAIKVKPPQRARRNISRSAFARRLFGMFLSQFVAGPIFVFSGGFTPG